MFQGHRVGALILMGGNGLRFGGETPKQFIFLDNRRVYLHTLDAFLKTELFDEIILVCHKDWEEIVKAETIGVKVVAGGLTRQKSSYLGLRAFQNKPDLVAIHDAVRPFISGEILKENIEKALLHGAVDTCIPSADTLVFAPGGEKIESIPARSDFLRGQTPQTFRYDLILKAHEAALREEIENASDDCQLALRLGHAVHIVRGSEKNIKITTEFDLMLAENLILASVD